MKKFVFTFIALMCCTVMNAQPFTDGAYTYMIRSENTVGIMNVPNLSGRFVIPTTVTNPDDGKTYNVTRIESHCFIMSQGITSVTIPEGITFIGQGAFWGCQITDLVIPSTVTSIEKQAFYNCSSLTSVTIKSGSIGEQAFDECRNLTSISLQEGVTSIGAKAFRECKQLEGDLVIPSTVTNIGEEAFYNLQLTSVKVFALVPPELGNDALHANTIYVPDDEKYKKCDGWKNFQNIKLLTDFRLGDQMYALNETGGGRYLDQELTFNDKVSYISYFDFTAKKLTYSRTFKATGVWQAWFVPFDVTVSDMNAAGMEVAEIAGVLMDENKQPYIAFAKMTNTDAIVNANTPYVVKATESSVNMTLTGPDMCIRKSTDAELKAQRLTVQSSFDTFTFGGNYQQTNGYENEWYALNTSGTFQKMGDGANLAPQRFWMTIDTRTDTPYHTGSSATAKAFIGMTVLGDDETTRIESLTPTLSEGNGVIYNLQGQRVTSIQKGQVYIVNGKKYLAR